MDQVRGDWFLGTNIVLQWLWRIYKTLYIGNTGRVFSGYTLDIPRVALKPLLDVRIRMRKTILVVLSWTCRSSDGSGILKMPKCWPSSALSGYNVSSTNIAVLRLN